MSSLLQQVMAELHQLSTQEKWQVMSHLVSDLQHQTASPPLDRQSDLENERSARNSRRQEDEVEAFMQEIEGSWGNLSREEVDAQLERQRRFDWGE